MITKRLLKSVISKRDLTDRNIGRTQLLLPPTLNVAFRFFEPRIVEPFPNEKFLWIAATKRTIFHWETAPRFAVRKIFERDIAAFNVGGKSN